MVGRIAGIMHCLHCATEIKPPCTQCPICNMPIDELRFPVGRPILIWIISVVILGTIIARLYLE
jgi:hypothetical protein